MRKGITSSYTGLIIGINIVVFLVVLILSYVYGINKTASLVALQPSSIIAGQKLWTLLTNMFVHFDLWHLIANMLSLVFIGSFVERLIGKKRYLWLYLIGGLFAGILFIALSLLFGNSSLGERLFGSPFVFAIGASGAIFALGGLLAVLVPKLKVLVFFVIPMPMWAAMTFFIFVLWVVSFGAGLPIGNSAHLGGLIVGLLYGFFLKSKYPRRVEMLRRRFE